MTMWNIHIPEEEKPSGDSEWEKFKQQLIDDFSDWLDELDEADFAGDVSHSAERPDLMSFYRELAALRQDVQIQAKNSHNVAQKLDAVSSDLNQQSSELGATIERLKSEIPQARRDARRGVCTKVIELIEAVQRTADQDLEVSLPRILLSRKRREDAASALHEPLRRLKRQADSVMALIGIEAIATVGAEFDAKTMRAVSQSNTGARPGTVTQIIRQGYVLDGDVIQLAEVQVEHQKESEE